MGEHGTLGIRSALLALKLQRRHTMHLSAEQRGWTTHLAGLTICQSAGGQCSVSGVV